jgi:hypothetical protein
MEIGTLSAAAMMNCLRTRGGSGLIFLGLGQARVEAFGLGLFRAFKI